LNFYDVIDSIESSHLFYLRGNYECNVDQEACFYNVNKKGVIFITPRNLYKRLLNKNLIFDFTLCNSRGEKTIAKYLLDNNIPFSTEVAFSNLRDRGHLRFDYAVLNDDGTLWFLIEFDGAQHFKYTPKYHKSYRDFEQSLYRDELKDEYCLYNNIPLLRISYKEENKIEEKIRNFASNLLSQSYIN
jgi:hypothetical protein